MFEYCIVHSDQAETKTVIEAILNENGADGWRLVQYTNKYLIFEKAEHLIPTWSPVDEFDPRYDPDGPNQP